MIKFNLPGCLTILVGIKKKQQFRKVTILLMATCLFHQNGMLECWPPVRSAYNLEKILGIKVEGKHFNCKKLLPIH